MSKTALLLIAHGSRNPDANADLFFVVDAMRQRGNFFLVESAFLEMVSPTIIEGGLCCVEQGAEEVILLPYFLSAGVHARQDLQDYRDKLEQRCPGVSFVVGKPLGRHPALLDIVAERAEQARAEFLS